MDRITSEEVVYVKKRAGESWHRYACFFCKRLVSYTSVYKKCAPGVFIGVHCGVFGHTEPCKGCSGCRVFVKARQRKLRWRR